MHRATRLKQGFSGHGATGGSDRKLFKTVTGRVGSGLEVLEILMGRVESCQGGFDYRGLSRVRW